jgi:hypothetical protein
MREDSETGSRSAQRIATRLLAVTLFVCGSGGIAPAWGRAAAAVEPPGGEPSPAATTGGVALPELERFNNGGSRLLYLYLRGLALHERGHWALSNQALADADALLEDLYTRHLSREAGAILVGDNVVEYRGERFESAYLHYYKILNYLELGQIEEAAVECRRLNHKLQRFTDDPEPPFSDEPFLQYLTGIVYAAAREGTDADVSLRNAKAAFERMGEATAVEAPACLDRDRAPAPAGAADSSLGQLRLFIETGFVPYRREASLVAPIFRNEIEEGLDESRYSAELASRLDRPVESHLELEYLLKVAVPTLIERPSPIASARILATRAGEAYPATIPAAKVADLGVQARRAFEERKPGIWVRAVGRALAKYLATRKVEQEGGELAGRVANLVGVATENADTRSWSTLPRQILMACADLAPGVYRLDIVLTGPHGERQGFVRIPEVVVNRGGLTVRSCRVRS